MSITRAVQKLYVTQPAVSSAVKELEKEFSVQLFPHVGRSVSFCTRPSRSLAGEKKITAKMLREELLLLYNTDSVQNRSIHQWMEAAFFIVL